MKQKFVTFAALLFFSLNFIAPSAVHAQADVDSNFNPNILISDAAFSDTHTFGGADGIQKFLVSKGSVLANTSPDFLVQLKEPQEVSVKQTLEDPEPNLPQIRTAAQLIWDASQAAGINPQVMLVTLNKEQSLITGTFSDPARLQRALDFSLGFGCPDSSACGDIYRGFYYQLFGGLDESGSRYLGAPKSLMRSFTTPGGRGPFYNGGASKVGDTIVLDNTLGGYNGVAPQQNVTLGNAATAALYRYTPHVFNGNYNFWRFFNSWFRFANGTLIRVSGDGNLYVIQNGTRQVVPSFVAQARHLDPNTAQVASSTEIQTYPDGGTYGLPDNTIISVNGQLFVFENNIRHPVSSFVLSQRKLNASTAITVSESDANIFPAGNLLTPSEGSVIRGQKNPAVYLVEGGTLKLFTPLSFAQYNAAAKMQIVPDSEIDTYAKNGLVTPLSGSLIKSSSNPTVYLLQDGVKHGLTAQVFANRALSFKNIIVLSDQDIAGFPDGGLALPTDNTVIKSRTDPTVYIILGGQVRPMTFAAFQNRKIKPANIILFSQSEIDAYPKGAIVSS